MFAKFPQKLASPFGLLGNDAKLSFRTQPGGIRKLSECRVRLYILSRVSALDDNVAILFVRISASPILTGIK